MRFSSLVSLAFITLAGCGSDITSQMVGTYTGSIVCTAVTSASYSVSVSAVDGDTITISGADFTAFDVDVMDVGGTVTTLPDDGENTLSWSGGSLSVTHSGAESVTFEGDLGGGADTASDGNGGNGANDDTGGGGNGGTEGAANQAEGTYHGAISGPVVSANYDLFVAALDADTVEVSGSGIDTFEVPVSLSGGRVEQAGTWSEGSFRLSGDTLALVHNPQGLSFNGSR